MTVDPTSKADDIGWPISVQGGVWLVGIRDVAIHFQRRESLVSKRADVTVTRTSGNRINSVYVKLPAVKTEHLVPAARAAIAYVLAKDETAHSEAQQNLANLQKRLLTNPPAGSVPLGRTRGYPSVSVIVAPSLDEEFPWIVEFVVDNPSSSN